MTTEEIDKHIGPVEIDEKGKKYQIVVDQMVYCSSDPLLDLHINRDRVVRRLKQLNSKYDENYLNKLINRAEGKFSDIDPEKWLSELRGCDMEETFELWQLREEAYYGIIELVKDTSQFGRYKRLHGKKFQLHSDKNISLLESGEILYLHYESLFKKIN